MMERADIERAIVDDELMIDQVADLLDGAADVADWPEEVRVALALALMDDAMSGTERWKSATLRRHLFGPVDVVPEQIASVRAPSPGSARRRAEGLRSALPARVRYRAAAYMLPAPRRP